MVLVLGPGLARSLAGAGVLMALEEAKIPIAGIVGTEMGGLIAGIYVTSASSNDFEWRLLQMKKDDFIKPKSGLSALFSGSATTTAMDEFIEKTLGAKEFVTGRAPLRIALKTPGGPKPVVIADQGPVGRAVRATMGVPGLYRDTEWSGAPSESAANEAISIADECAAFGSAPILVVDTTDKLPLSADVKVSDPLRKYLNGLPQSRFHRGEGATWVLRPTLTGIGYLDSDRSADAIYSGKKATAGLITKIREELSKE